MFEPPTSLGLAAQVVGATGHVSTGRWRVDRAAEPPKHAQEQVGTKGVNLPFGLNEA